MNDTTKVVVGLLVGATVGMVAGLLLAPQSGEETRQQLSDTADRVSKDLKKQSEKGLDALNDVKNSVLELVDDVQKRINKA